MELREAFEAADTDKGGALELEEVPNICLMCCSLYKLSAVLSAKV